MLPSAQRSTALFALAACLVLPLTSCAGSSTGKLLQESLAADPRLKSEPIPFGVSASPTPIASTSQTTTLASLPAGFPSEIPVYPNAQLQATADENQNSFRWVSSDAVDRVQSFYQREFQTGWQVLSQPSDHQSGTFEAQRNGLKVTVSIQPADTPAPATVTPVSPTPTTATSGTTFAIQYTQTANAATTQADVGAMPKPGDPDFVGPVMPAETTTAASNSGNSANNSAAQSGSRESNNFTDLSKAPPELRQYIENLSQLGVLSLTSTNGKSAVGATLFEPNKIVTRREYARWLVATNNRLYGDRPAQQIRLGQGTSQPAFRDMPRSDPDFAAIQGLAEAGLLPSSLSGSSTTVLFRPDAPLTRENLILWKVPVDTRQALPQANLAAVKETWGFQDAARIEPPALRAVLADYQSGDTANIRRVFGYTTLFQPKKSVTRAEAAAALWYFGAQGEGISAQDALKTNQTS